MTDYCDKTELPTDQCAHCQGHDALPDKPQRLLGSVVTAQWPGECGHCGERFREGDEIALAVVDGHNQWCKLEHTKG